MIRCMDYSYYSRARDYKESSDSASIRVDAQNLDRGRGYPFIYEYIYEASFIHQTGYRKELIII